MENPGAQLFDIEYWLDSPSDFYKANRCGLGKLVPLEHLPASLRRLIDVGVVGRQEAVELLKDLGVEVQRGDL